ncbi:MAG TPA: hypothetical protein VLI93_04710, partial [Acetobacteraceae bacterium]|nr:hypothetical protein [Acetobacteraceae bacterium]
IRQVIVPPLPGVFSALGLLVADTEHHLTQSLRTRVDAADPVQVGAVLDALATAGETRLTRDGFDRSQTAYRRTALARYVGQSSEIEVALADQDAASLLKTLPDRFAAEHERTYGFRAPPDEPVELVGFSVIARGIPAQPRLPAAIPPVALDVPSGRRAWFAETGWIDIPVMDRAGLSDAPRGGPLIVQEYDATCLVPHGGHASLDVFGNIRVRM